jgi:hypothetical protein
MFYQPHVARVWLCRAIRTWSSHAEGGQRAAITGELIAVRACNELPCYGGEGDQVVCGQERPGGREWAVPFGEDASERPAEQVAGSFAFGAVFFDGRDFGVVLESLEHAGKQQVASRGEHEVGDVAWHLDSCLVEGSGQTAEVVVRNTEQRAGAVFPTAYGARADGQHPRQLLAAHARRLPSGLNDGAANHTRRRDRKEGLTCLNPGRPGQPSQASREGSLVSQRAPTKMTTTRGMGRLRDVRMLRRYGICELGEKARSQDAASFLVERRGW